MTPVLLDRLADSIEFGPECWDWTPKADARGYGVISIRNRLVGAHRAVYEAVVERVPEGLELDHLCRNTRCVNPDHLEPVTHQVNMSRGRQAMKTHCPRGHTYTGSNVYRDPLGRRMCRTCHREREAAKRRAAGIPERDGSRCKHGHLLTAENTYVRKDNGHRQCRTCKRERDRRYAQGRTT